MLTWVFLFPLLAFSHSWVLKVKPSKVAKKLTPNVTFLCHYDGTDNEETEIAHVSRIRLMKLMDNKKWTTVAKMSDFRPEVTTTFSYHPQASGHAGNRSSSFLSLTFAIATDDVIGQFMCEIDGYDEDDELAVVKTDPVVIAERGLSYQDLLNIILSLKEEEEGTKVTTDLRLGLLEKAVRLQEKQSKSRDKAISDLANSINLLNSDFLKISDDIINKQREILADLDTIKQVTRIERQAWPEGVYSLHNTTTGCPSSFSFDWTKSSVRITTQQGNANQDSMSFPNHLVRPVLEASGNYHYVHMKFCTKKAEVAGPAWPKGSYCVNSYSGLCPKNLYPGSIQIDRENIGSYDSYTDLTLRATYEYTEINYCCRNDGDAGHPVLLPAKDPFYLYRFEGKCQEVIGMDVSNEWLFLDTKETNDRFTNTTHPDASLKDIRLELCYYSPKA